MELGTAATTVHAGTGGLNLGTTADARTTNFLTGAANQTLNIATADATHTIKVGNQSGSFINIIDNSTHAQDDILIKNTSGTGDDAAQPRRWWFCSYR